MDTMFVLGMEITLTTTVMLAGSIRLGKMVVGIFYIRLRTRSLDSAEVRAVIHSRLSSIIDRKHNKPRHATASSRSVEMIPVITALNP